VIRSDRLDSLLTLYSLLLNWVVLSRTETRRKNGKVPHGPCGCYKGGGLRGPCSKRGKVGSGLLAKGCDACYCLVGGGGVSPKRPGKFDVRAGKERWTFGGINRKVTERLKGVCSILKRR